MADLKLVGAVAIKVRPTADGFREDAEKQVKKEARDLKAEVELEAKLESKEAKKDGEKLKKELDGKTVSWNVKLDHDSVRAAQKQFDSMLDPTAEIKFKIGDEKSIEKARQDLENLAKSAQVKVTYAQDEKGYQEVLAKIAAIRRQKLEETIHFGISDAELDAKEKEIREKLAAFHPEVEVQTKQIVDIEYHEDREGFQAAINRINSELRKLDALHLEVELDRGELLAARDLMQEQMDKEPLIFKYNEDEAGYKKILKQIEDLQRQKLELDIDLNLSDAELAAKHAEFQAKLDALTPAQQHVTQEVTFKYNNDRAGLEALIKEINAKIREIDQINLTVELDKDKLLAERAIAEAALAKLPTKIEYNNNVASIRKAIAEVNAYLDKERYKLSIETKLDEASLLKTKAKLERQLGRQKIHIEYETDNLASLQAARAQIMALLPIEHKTHITTKLNEKSLLEALAKIDGMIKAATPEVKPKVKPEIKAADYLKVAGALALLAKNQTVGIFVKLNNASVLLAMAKLTGLRAASRWTEAFARSLGTLDRNLPIVAAAVVGLNTLTSGVLTLTAGAFSLGNGLGEIVRMAALLAPAMILGFAAVKTVFTGVFKDFGAAVNGDKTAIKKLTESGKEAAANMRVIFQDMREAISNNFWDKASDSMLRFTKTALPEVKNGMADLSTSMGGVFAGIVDAFSVFAEQNGIDVFFANLIRGFDNMRNGMAPFMSAFLNLAALGSTIFPRMGSAFDAMSQKFDAWVNRMASDGTFSRWIDQGVQGIKDLWSAGVSLVKVWGNIGQAAQGAGALTLHSFAGALAALENVTSGSRFQNNMLIIFRGAREASDSFHDSLKGLAPAMDVFSVTVHNALANSGKALAAFIGVLGDVFSSKNLDIGLTAFLGGVKRMFEELRPAAAPVTEILKIFGQLLGQVASDSGPLFRNLFTQLATVMATAYRALEPFLPALIQIGTNIVNVLGPALSNAAGLAIPSFVNSILKIGDGLVPVIKAVSDFTVGLVGMVSDMPTPLLVGLVTTILALGGAMKFAATVLPVVNAALKVLGSTAFLTGTQMTLAIPVVGIFLAALTGLVSLGLTSYITAQSSGTKYANEFATALEADAKAAGKVTGAIGDMTKAAIVDKLTKEGAYSAAKDLGISNKELTEAAIKGGKAWENVQSKINAATGAYDDASTSIIASSGEINNMTEGMSKHNDSAKKLKDVLDNVKGSVEHDTEALKQNEEGQKNAGIQTEKSTGQQKKFEIQLNRTGSELAAMAAATNVLSDSTSSGAAKIDAMRKTFDLLVGKDAKQAAAETLGAYAQGFQDLGETVKPLAGQMQELGDAVYGESGFLNVAGGNKAVMQVNQALVDEVNNVWLGAKAAYDAAIKQGDTAKVAFEKAQQFINDHHGDFNQLAADSGVNADLVQGQWEAVFGKEWVLKVSFSGATEAAGRAQAMITALKGQWDGQEFMATFDADSHLAVLAAKDPTAAAEYFVNKKWKATLDAIPGPAKVALQKLTKQTDEDWAKKDFFATFSATVDDPSLQEAVLRLRNGIPEPGDLQAMIYAATNDVSFADAKAKVDAMASDKTAKVTVDAETEAANKKLQAVDDNVDRTGKKVAQPIVDPVTEDANAKLEATYNNVDRIGGQHPQPIVDPLTSDADTKLNNTYDNVDRIGKQHPQPLVDPQTSIGDARVARTQDLMNELDRLKARPFVDAQTGEASRRIAELQAQINSLTGRAVTMTITTEYLTSGSPVHGAGQVIAPAANGAIFRNLGNRMVKQFANGGIENHVAQIQRAGGPVRVWAEPETKAEAYIPYAAAKRPRSLRILRQVARDFGYDLTKASYYANGGINAGPSTTTHTSANVHIGTMITTDPDEAVRKLDQARRDALAVAGIH